MKKEIGKWFMDVAKYVLTAVIVGNFISDIQDIRWLVYAGGILVTLVCLTIGLAFLHESNPKKEGSN